MSYSLKLINRKMPVGDVTITFDDDSVVSQKIDTVDVGEKTSVGTFFSESATITPVEISALGQSWKYSDLPGDVTYPDSTIGKITQETVTGGGGPIIWYIYLDMFPG